MTVSSRHFFVPALALIAAALSCVGIAAAQPVPAYPIIDPANLPVNSIDEDFGPRAAEVRAAYQKYTIAARAKKLELAPSQKITTTANKQVDLKDTFTVINQINIALAIEHKPQLTALQPGASIPQTSKTSLEAARRLLLPHSRFAAFAAPVPGPPTPTPTAPLPAGAKPCPGAAPGAFDPDAGWNEIKQLPTNKNAAGAALDRCSLSMAHALDGAESRGPVIGNALQPVVLDSIFHFGNSLAHAEFDPAMTFSQDGAGTRFHGETALTANVFGFKSKMTLFSLSTEITSPNTGSPSVVVSVIAGRQPVYSTTLSPQFPKLPVSIAPTETIDLFPRLRTHINDILPVPFGIGVDTELACVGKVGINGTIQTTGSGVYLRAKPLINVTLDGGFTATFLVASARIDGELTLVDVNGDMGVIAAVVNDPTASSFLPTAFGTTTPVLAIYRPFGTINYKALQGSLKVTARIAGIKVPWSPTIPISAGVTQNAVSIDKGWNAVYLTNATAGATS